MSLSKTKYRKKKLKKSNRKRKYSPKNQTRRKRRTRKYKKQKGGAPGASHLPATASAPDAPDAPDATDVAADVAATFPYNKSLESQIKSLISSLPETIADALSAHDKITKSAKVEVEITQIKIVIYDSLGNKIKVSLPIKRGAGAGDGAGDGTGAGDGAGDGDGDGAEKKNQEQILGNEYEIILKYANGDENLIKYFGDKSKKTLKINKTIFNNNLNSITYEGKDEHDDLYKFKFKAEKINTSEFIKVILTSMIFFLGIFVFGNIQSNNKKNYKMDINVKGKPSKLKNDDLKKEINPGRYLGSIMDMPFDYPSEGAGANIIIPKEKRMIEFFDNLGYSIEYKNKFRYILTINPT